MSNFYSKAFKKAVVFALFVGATVNAQTTYCVPTYSGWAVNEPAEPITLVQFGTGTGSINNSSTDVVSTATPRYEDYSSISMNVQRGQTYDLKVKGTTNGNFTNYITVYFDWNGDGVFSNTTPPDAAAQQQLTNQPEKHQHTTAIVNSTGIDNIEMNHTVTIPNDAVLGTIRMRVVKNMNAPSNSPCTNPFFPRGQVEDYTLNVVNAGTTPNPCTAVATIDEDFETFTAFPENCWTSNKSTPMADLDADKTSANQFISLYSFMSANDPIYLVTPELSTIDGNHLLEFDIVSTNAASSNIEVGTMTDNTDFSTFVPVGTAFNLTVGTHSSAYIPANAGHKYVAIKFTSNGQHQAVSIDNVKWTTTAATPTFDTSKVTVYPNPTTGIFNVESDLDIKQMEVYNSLGQKILTTTNRQINLQTAANGLYFVTVTTNNGAQASYKLIKK
ncbi:GEVED domain-containing protein [Flavobacterium dauae]|uniref:GEVED domain-containing protein n=1 Tax=Flavobacterium dauae TaxID=1563479 RepID=UPI00101B3A65|nr:GEVED domain-containing protein [Flavobacterium dauae]WLD23624.1 GEVED domain-containing protein [Flavobacterium dauae]